MSLSAAVGRQATWPDELVLFASLHCLPASDGPGCKTMAGFGLLFPFFLFFFLFLFLLQQQDRHSCIEVASGKATSHPPIKVWSLAGPDSFCSSCSSDRVRHHPHHQTCASLTCACRIPLVDCGKGVVLLDWLIMEKRLPGEPGSTSTSGDTAVGSAQKAAWQT